MTLFWVGGNRKEVLPPIWQVFGVPERRLQAVWHVDLLVSIIEMGLDRMDTDKEFVANLCICAPRGYHLEHLFFSAGKGFFHTFCGKDSDCPDFPISKISNDRAKSMPCLNILTFVLIYTGNRTFWRGLCSPWDRKQNE
jgi:hypothetical protein